MRSFSNNISIVTKVLVKSALWRSSLKRNWQYTSWRFNFL